MVRKGTDLKLKATLQYVYGKKRRSTSQGRSMSIPLQTRQNPACIEINWPSFFMRCKMNNTYLCTSDSTFELYFEAVR